jgi:Spherulation-specific family 4
MTQAARIISAAIIVGVVACGGGPGPEQSARTASSATASVAAGGSIIPLYSWPTDVNGNVVPDWNTVAAEQQRWPAIAVIPIVNNQNGPGPGLDPNWTKGINVLVAGGCKVAGYVYTQYGKRSLTKVERDIANWRAWYPQITALFLDQMSNTAGKESYYSTLTSYAKSRGFDFVIGNPGTATIPSYVGTVDTIVVYENTSVPTSFSSWQASYSKSNFATLSYSVPYSSFPSSQVTANKSSVAFQYVTDDGPDGNPWDELSTYLDTLLSLLN